MIFVLLLETSPRDKSFQLNFYVELTFRPEFDYKSGQKALPFRLRRMGLGVVALRFLNSNETQDSVLTTPYFPPAGGFKK